MRRRDTGGKPQFVQERLLVTVREGERRKSVNVVFRKYHVGRGIWTLKNKLEASVALFSGGGRD